MLDIPPPPASTSALSAPVDRGRGQMSGDDEDDDVSVVVVSLSDEDHNGWKLVERRGRKERESHLKIRGRRRTASASERSSNPSSPMTPPPMQPVNERTGLVEAYMGELPGTSSTTGNLRMARSRTLPAGRARGGEVGSMSGEDSVRHRNVLRKGKGGRPSVLPVQRENMERTKDDSG